MQPYKRWQEEKERHSKACLKEPLNTSPLIWFSVNVWGSQAIWVCTPHQRMKVEVEYVLHSMTLVLWPRVMIQYGLYWARQPRVSGEISPSCISTEDPYYVRVLCDCICMGLCLCSHTHTQNMWKVLDLLDPYLALPVRVLWVLFGINTHALGANGDSASCIRRDTSTCSQRWGQSL